MDESIRAIIAAGIRAPSGDNCQPWSFRVQGDRIDLFNEPERDTSLYNHLQRASLVAHGACIENMLIASRVLGWAPGLHLFPTSGDERHVATITLQPAQPTQDPLHSAIFQRSINRRRYAGGSLAADAVECLEFSAQGIAGAWLTLLRNREDLAVAANVVALSDRLVFENRDLHAFLFDHVRWSAAEAELTRDGLDLGTLELAPPDRLFFPLLKSYPLVSLLSRFGVTSIIAANARRLMLSASLAGVITIENSSSQSWLAAGRVLERVWLEATRQGLAFHLMTGITLLIQRCNDGVTDGMSQGNLALVDRADALLGGITTAAGPVALLFRIGVGGQPSVRSLRRDVESVLYR